MLSFPDKWLWDFWFAKDGPYYHIFYLQAPRSLGDEKQRHWHATIGHAVSEDLRSWEILPDALVPTSKENAWDNYTTWTGSVIRYAGLWYLFYTGTNREEKGLIQRIGLATSDDLINWRKFPKNPVIEVDQKWYELLESGQWPDQAWRDPWVFWHEGSFHAYITARTKDGPSLGRGVIARATSSDLMTWEVHEPVTAPGEFGHLEVPQLAKIGDRWYLLFCTDHQQYSEQRLAKPGLKLETGTHYLVGDNPLGPFEMIADQFLLGDKIGTNYAGKTIQDPAGNWVLLAARAWSTDGYIGEIGDPMPLVIDQSGRLSLRPTDIAGRG
ncbi:MAG TPA: glycosyl hydrolase family 32 [candidate division Zixibacteria bacterium]|nr:glycosyl hydrolase family 32 [candidate division Zixibacteria bacterium]